MGLLTQGMGVELAGKRWVDAISRPAVRVCAYYAMASASYCSGPRTNRTDGRSGIILQILGAVQIAD